MEELIKTYRETIVPGIYRHFKGNLYEVLNIALHSETKQVLVIYRSVEKSGVVWARPAEMWNDEVDFEGTREAVDGLMGTKPEARFRFIQERAAFAENLDI